MRRRSLLSLTCGAVAGLAGCGRVVDRDAGPTDPTMETTTSNSSGQLSVALTTDRYLVRTSQVTQRGLDGEDVVPGGQIAPVLRDALSEARDDRFETSDPSEPLLSAIDEFRTHGLCYRFRPYVELDGVVYEFVPKVPELEVSLVPDAEDPDPDRTIQYEDVDHDSEASALVETIAVTTAHSCRDEYRVSVVPEDVEAFLESYDYLEATTTGRIATEWVDPGPPYTIDVRELTDEDWWGRPVVDTTDLSDDLRAFLDAAVHSERRARADDAWKAEYRTSGIPDEYQDVLVREGDDPYVRVAGDVYRVRTTSPDRDRAPIEIDVQPEPEAEPPDEQRLRFTVTVTAVERPAIDGRIEVASHGGLPTVLWMDVGGERRLLESDANETIEWVEDEDGNRRITNVVREELHPEGIADADASVDATYALPEEVPPGTYTLWGYVGVSWVDPDPDRRRDGEPYPFQVIVQIQDGSD